MKHIDFVQVFSSSTISLLGALNNDPATIIASMLISPLSDPLISYASNLEIHSVVRHLKMVAIAWSVGFLGGKISSRYNVKPTVEIENRAKWVENKSYFFILSVCAGVFLASAIRSESEFSSAHVGFGIVTSFLPPVVISGILSGWATEEKRLGISSEELKKMSLNSFKLYAMNAIVLLLCVYFLVSL